MILDQIRKLRSLSAEQRATYEARIAALEAQLAQNADAQAELDAFENDLKPKTDA